MGHYAGLLITLQEIPHFSLDYTIESKVQRESRADFLFVSFVSSDLVDVL